MSSAFRIAPRCPHCAFLKATISRFGFTRGATRVKPLVSEAKRIGSVLLTGRSMMNKYNSNACNVWHRAAPLIRFNAKGSPSAAEAGNHTCTGSSLLKKPLSANSSTNCKATFWKVGGLTLELAEKDILEMLAAK